MNLADSPEKKNIDKKSLKIRAERQGDIPAAAIRNDSSKESTQEINTNVIAEQPQKDWLDNLIESPNSSAEQQTIPSSESFLDKITAYKNELLIIGVLAIVASAVAVYTKKRRSI